MQLEWVNFKYTSTSPLPPAKPMVRFANERIKATAFYSLLSERSKLTVFFRIIAEGVYRLHLLMHGKSLLFFQI